MLPRMQLRRSSFWTVLCVAAATLPLFAGGCHHDKTEQHKQQRGSSSGIQPGDLKLDMSGLPRNEATAPPEAGTLGLTLAEFEKRWNARAQKHGMRKISHWKRQGVPAFQAWRAVADLGPGLTLEVVGIKKDAVQSADISQMPFTKGNEKAMFGAWETLRETASPDVSQDQLYKGLKLLSKPTAPTRYMTAGDYVWEFKYVPLQPPPNARIMMAVHRARPVADPGEPFSMLVRLGGGSHLGSFSVQYAPASRGKTFDQAARFCAGQGLSLCSVPQWQRACTQFEGVSKISTWTSSFNKKNTQLQTEGGEGRCTTGISVAAKDKDGKRGALCCTRNLAMTGAGDVSMSGLFAVPILMFERSNNKKEWKHLGKMLSPKLEHFYKLDNASRADAIQLLQDNAKKHPDQWTAFQSCSLKPGKLPMHFLASCTRNTFEGDQGMKAVTQFSLDRSHIVSVKDSKVLRKMGPI